MWQGNKLGKYHSIFHNLRPQLLISFLSFLAFLVDIYFKIYSLIKKYNKKLTRNVMVQFCSVALKCLFIIWLGDNSFTSLKMGDENISPSRIYRCVYASTFPNLVSWFVTRFCYVLISSAWSTVGYFLCRCHPFGLFSAFFWVCSVFTFFTYNFILLLLYSLLMLSYKLTILFLSLR